MKYLTYGLAILAASMAARADFLYHDTATTSGGQFVAGTVVFGIGNLKDAGHTSHLDTENTATNGTSYATANPPTGGFPVTITLDFAEAVDLSKFYLWNHSNSNGGGAPANGVGAFSLTFFDGASGGGSQIGAVFNGSALAAPGTGSADYAAQVFDLATTYEHVRSVVLTILNKQGGSTSGFVAMREIGFEGTATVAATDFLYHDSATTNGGQFTADFTIGNLKNGGYISPTATEDASAQAINLSYATTNPPAMGYPVRITFEFDSPTSLEAFHLWNHCNAGSTTAVNQGVNAFTLDFYDGPGGSGSQIGSPFSANAAKAPAAGTFPAETFNFVNPYVGVRSVVMTANNHNPNSNFVAMREAGFKGTRTPTPLPTPDKVIVYLVGGQSNADGYGVTSQLTAMMQAPQPDIDFYHGNGGGNSPLPAGQWIPLQPGSGSMAGNAGGFGPELNFGIGIHDALGSERARIAVIKHTLGGTNLHTQWFPGGNATTSGDGTVYLAFQTTVGNALQSLAARFPAATIQVEGMIWHQGEADAGSDANAAAYQTNLANFIADVRATYASDLKFGIVQLSNNQTSLNATRLATVKAGQAAVAAADPLSYLVTTDDVPMATVGNIHFGTTGVQTIGSRLATGMRQVPITDGDGNGLDDDWEEFYWGVGNTGQPPGDDDDKDGLTNLQEFLWLTHPRVSNVISPALQSSPDLSLTWPSSPNRRYLIEVSPDLATWERFDSFIPGSETGSSSYALPADPAASLRFFRVGVHR
jgi:hypothetical protein